MTMSRHRTSCYGAIGELQCDNEHCWDKPGHEGPSLIERMVHLSTLRGRWVSAREHASLHHERDEAATYIAALEAEAERHGLVIDRSTDATE